ncbi:hypothetical protein DPEC_G00122990 [Dallia pectoralis]|uniref:Uncharacterized protein n=1 Tax=Dallia pectoralis TaxID=75939 RepID=A0ACC2GQF0_DALPE|nr:hypothetical protein DPEC_G00122990 [Dallia pectoralis]
MGSQWVLVSYWCFIAILCLDDRLGISFRMASDDLRAERERIEQQILALERTLGPESNSIELSSDSCASDDGSDDDGSQTEHLGPSENLKAERQRIQREIEELENTLGPGVDAQGGATESSEDDSGSELDLPQNTETCLQMNLVYQEVLGEKLEELEQLLSDNQQQQNEIMASISSTGNPPATTSGQPALKLFLGNFLKPYFRDRFTFMGPPANPEAKEIMAKRLRPHDDIKMKRWEGWQKTLLTNAVVKDSMKRMIQPKLSKVEYLTQKMAKAENTERQILQKQITEIEKEIENISALKENELTGGRYDDHDWQKISNIDFEGIREAEDLKNFWQNYLHPSINKAIWKENEIKMLKQVAQKHENRHWDEIADELGTNRTAFMCLQTYQRYICVDFRKRVWISEEDEILRELVEKMRIGNYIPYTQISYFMEGRQACQLMYRWTQCLDPTLKKGYWSKHEDEMLRKAVAKYGVGNWWKIRQEVPGRTDGQCRDRYLDVLIGNVKKGPFDEKEQALLRRLVDKYGFKWSKIAAEIPNRLDCQVLNNWRKMTGYKVSARPPRVRRRKALSKKKRKSLKKRLHTSYDDDDYDEEEDEEDFDMEFMDSDDEEEQTAEPDGTDNGTIPEYNQPDIDQWIPTTDKMLERPGMLRPLMVERPSEDGSREKLAQAATVGQLAPHKFLGVRSTILDRFGKPAATVIADNPRTLARKDYRSDLAMLKVCYGEVKHFIHWKKTNAANKTQSVSDDQDTPSSPSRKNTNSAHSERSSTFNYALQLGVVPWVGNVLIPPPLPSTKLREADMVRERAEKIGLANTSVFLFFLQVLQVDAEGCKQIINMRSKQAMVDSFQETKLVLSTKQKQPPNLKTVAGMLRHREQEQKARQQEQKARQQQNSQLTVIPPTLVVAQPSAKESPSWKRARTRSPPKDTPMSQPSNMVLHAPQNTWVLTPNGLLSLGGINVQMVPQNIPANFYAQPVTMNHQGPLTFNSAPCSPFSNFISVTVPRMTGQGMQTVATTLPQLNAPSPVLSVPVNPATLDPLPRQPLTGPLQAVGLSVHSGSRSAPVSQGGPGFIPLKPHARAPRPRRKKETIQFDPHLMFTEDPAQVRKWASGTNGVSLPGLGITLPYLPPFVSNLDTLSSLLKCKTMLTGNAKLILSAEEKENWDEEEQIAAVRRLVVERFSRNPGYLLLKARFLSCFTMPALLATIGQVNSYQEYSDVEEEPCTNNPEQQDTVREQPTERQAPLLSTDGTGDPANFFSGIITRNKCRQLNLDTERNVVVLD